MPCGPEQCQAHEQVLASIWQLYDELKAYRLAPSPSHVEILSASFDAVVSRTTCFPELDAALRRMAGNKADLLRVLERPDMPLHTNTVDVYKRQVYGLTLTGRYPEGASVVASGSNSLSFTAWTKAK